MKVTIQKAKNGEDTVCVDGHFLHSNYAPLKEAERYVQNLNPPYNPSLIIISEPALSYCADFLRQRFPAAKIGVIRYIKDFSIYNSRFDFVLNYFEHPDFEAYLEKTFNEEQLLTAFFTPWQASSQVFSEADKTVWASIKAVLERAKTILITRQYFEKKWFINSCNFIKELSSVISISKPVEKDALIISSGPSLIPFIDYIRENQNKFFIICLSSALSVCLENEIIPDLCMTSDGGYWAGQHLKPLEKYPLPLAMPAEAYCPKELLNKLPLLPLNYTDGISSEIISASKLEAMSAVRNGTVSGTALLFAASYCTKNIYLCGLDMAGQKGFQHAQPNQLEKNSAIKDSRINTKEARLTRSEYNSGSLEIYKNWFCSNPLKLENRKVYRLIQNEDCKNNLVWIEDIELDNFKEKTADIPATEKIIFEKQKLQKDFSGVLKLLADPDKSSEWKKQLFPLDYILLSHNPKNLEVQQKIEDEWNELKNKAEEILNGNI